MKLRSIVSCLVSVAWILALLPADPALAATQPSPPTGLVATRGDGTASVAFLAPVSDGGSAITGYLVTCSSSDGGATGSAPGSASPIVVSGLTNGKTYTCTATATNAVGTSAPSAVSNGFVPATVPDAPTGLAATARNGAASVAFTLPASNGGSAITSFVATCASSDGGATGAASGAGSPLVVNGLTNGNTYTCTATATNAVGTSAPSAASNGFVPSPVAPGAPTALAATPGNDSVSVAFSPPASDGGSAITGYLVTCTSSDGGATSTAPGSASPIVVTGLTIGKTYRCTATATNAFGTSAPSAVSNSFTAAAVPGAPTGLVGTLGNGSASVAFSAPAFDGGSAVTSYLVTCASSDGGATGSASGSGSPILVTGLTNGNTYTCTATASNVAGTSAPSAASNSFVPATVPPDPPTGLVATRGDGSVSVVLSPPANDGGSAITGYLVTCTSSNGGATGSASGSGSPVVVGGLTNGDNYTCTATATNGVGTSTLSAASNTFVPATVPDPPTGLVGTRGSGSASVAFIMSANNGGSAVTGYLVTCVSSDGGATGSASGSASPIVVNGLTNGNNYTCTATATNAVGASAPSAPSNSFLVAPFPPGSPTGLVGTRGDGSASVAFAAPASNGGSAITSFAVTCVSSDGGATGSASGPKSPIVVSGLTNGNTYTCTATASNVAGTSAPSAPSATFVPSPLPDPPTGLVGTRGNGSASVAFTAPANNGGSAITSYLVTCTSSDGGATGSAPGPASPIVVSGLTNGNTYTCTATATNAAGTSAPSAASNSLLVAAVSGPPTALVATRGDTSASIAFTAPASDGGSAIVSYLVTCTSSDGGTTGSASGSGSPIVVSGLTNGKSYSCTATATNGSGASVPSAASNGFVPATVPGPPTGLVGTRGNSSVSVAFAAPASNGGSAITSFAVTCASSDGGATGAASGPATPIVVGGLTSGNTYSCTATATNAVGTGSPSGASSSFIAVSCATCVSVGDRAMHEGDSGTHPMIFSVTLSRPATSSVTVQYAVTADMLAGDTATGGAKPGPGIDFMTRTGTITFAAGAVSRYVSVNVLGDTTIEADETFRVTLSNPSPGFALGRSIGKGTILNDDGIASGATMGVGDTSIVGAAGGHEVLKFEVTLSAKVSTSVNVAYTITPGSATHSAKATGGGDFGGSTSGTLSFAAGSTLKTINVPIWADPNPDTNETFTITLSGLNGTGVTLIHASATATIIGLS